MYGGGVKSYRNIFVTSPARITVSSEQLIITTDQKYSVPIEDICSVILESTQITVTAYSLSALAQNNVCLYTCDSKHMPCAVLLGFNQHSRHLRMLKNQLGITKPKQKRLWQQIVVAKIVNQARCLKLCEMKTEADKLMLYSRQVTSGDPTNVEGTAAAFYFRALFGSAFSRSFDNGVNSALNYGYAIIRGALSRSLVSYGYLPVLGVHHHSELNQFNLADDFMEPLRPVVDLFVACGVSEGDVLNTNIKLQLFNLLNTEILSGTEKHSVSYAIERMVQSFGRCISSDNTKLVLPELLPLKQHEYE